MKKTPALSFEADKRGKKDVPARPDIQMFFQSSALTEKHKAKGVGGFCRTYAVTRDTFTRLAGFSPRAVANWVRGSAPSASTERRLTELDRMFAALAKLVKTEAIGPWLKTPNPAFDGSTPLQVIERGETDRIWRMIYELESGEPG